MAKICSAPWNTISIVPDGGVFSCLCAAWTHRVIGNLLEQSLADIYSNSIALDELRDRVYNGDYRFCNETMCPNVHSLDRIPVGVEHADLVVQNLPTTINLGIDKNCNLKCPSCRSERTFDKSIDPVVWKILENLQQTYKEFTSPVHVFCDGSGDLFTSEAYNKFLFGGELPECFRLSITTNGNLISKKMPQILGIKNQIINVIVSLDAATSETYAITRGGDFNIVLAGIKQLRDAGIKVNLQFVLQKANYRELIPYKEIANKLKVSFGVQLLNRWDHMSDEYWAENSIDDKTDIDLKSLYEELLYVQNDPTCNFNGGVITLMKRIRNN